MAGSWTTLLIAQNGNSTVTYSLSGRRYRIVTAGIEGGNSAIGVRRHNALPDGNHHVNVEVIGAGAASFRIAGYEV